MKPTITVLYSCAGCGLDTVPCVVPQRDGEDVTVWMQQTIRLLSDDHRQRSPSCDATGDAGSEDPDEGEGPHRRSGDPMRPKKLAVNVCPYCKEEFTPIPRADGSLPGACPEHIRKFNAQHRRGVVPAVLAPAIERRRQTHRERVESEARARFGPLSARESQIFNYAAQAGYDRGYQKGYHQTVPKRKSAA